MTESMMFPFVYSKTKEGTKTDEILQSIPSPLFPKCFELIEQKKDSYCVLYAYGLTMSHSNLRDCHVTISASRFSSAARRISRPIRSPTLIVSPYR